MQDTQPESGGELNERHEGLFDKLVHPVGQTKLKLADVGLYNLPEEFINHHGTQSYNYALKFLGFKVDKGVGLVAKEKTEEELFLEEQEKLNKAKKAKKGDEVPPEVAAKLEAFKIAKEKEQMRLDSLPADERHYEVSEDIKKKPSFRFKSAEFPGTPDADSYAFELSGEELVAFEEGLYSSRPGFWVVLTRTPAIEGDELVKLKKKLKPDQLRTLIPLKLCAFVSLAELRKKEIIETVVRAELQAVTNPNDPPENQPPEYGWTKCYLKLRLSVSQPFNPEIADYQLKLQDLVPKPPVAPKPLASAAALLRLKNLVKGLMPDLAKHYQTAFGAELVEERRAAEERTPLDKGQGAKRASEFSEQFKSTEEFDRMKTELMPKLRKVVKTVLGKEGEITGVQRDGTDAVYSKIFEIFSDTSKQALNELVSRLKDEQAVKTLASPAYGVESCWSFVQKVTGDNKKDRFSKLSLEYEKAGLLPLAISRLKTLLEEGHNDVLRRYVEIELKSHNWPVVEEFLLQLLGQGEHSFQTQFRLLALYISRGLFKKALIASKTIEEKFPGTLEVTLVRYHLYKNAFPQPALADKLLDTAKRIKKRELSLIPAYNRDGMFITYFRELLLRVRQVCAPQRSGRPDVALLIEGVSVCLCKHKQKNEYGN